MRAHALAVILAVATVAVGGRASAADSLRAPAGASSCSGCHAAGAGGGDALPVIAGRPAAETLAAMVAFRSGERPATLMNRIAKGFTDPEIAAIAGWLERQKPPVAP